MTGATAMLGLQPGQGIAAVEPPPETTTLRILRSDPACYAPIYVA